MIKRLEELNLYNVDKRFGKKILNEGHMEKVLEILSESNRVGLVTGFAVKPSNIGETDGPLGTVCLGRALEKLGKEVTFITDEYSKDLIKEGLNHYGLKANLLCQRKNESLDFSLDALMFIERPGKNKSGYFSSMRGEDISDIVTDTDYLFNKAKDMGIPVLSLGDGGNEAGMGLIRDHIAEHVSLGDQICAETEADFLILSAVSNWGCYGLCAGLSKIHGLNLLPSVEEETEHLRKIVDLGAVDGATKKNEMTVDGYSLDENMRILSRYLSF